MQIPEKPKQILQNCSKLKTHERTRGFAISNGPQKMCSDILPNPKQLTPLHPSRVLCRGTKAGSSSIQERNRQALKQLSRLRENFSKKKCQPRFSCELLWLRRSSVCVCVFSVCCGGDSLRYFTSLSGQCRERKFGRSAQRRLSSHSSWPSPLSLLACAAGQRCHRRLSLALRRRFELLGLEG